jgi:hypothetical protein
MVALSSPPELNESAGATPATSSISQMHIHHRKQGEISEFCIQCQAQLSRVNILGGSNIPSPKELILARNETEVKGKPNLKGI